MNIVVFNLPFPTDVPKLAPSNLPLPVKMAVLKQSTAAKDNQNSGKLIGMKFDHGNYYTFEI